MFIAKIIIKRRDSILDPQGAAVEKGAEKLGLSLIGDTRIGKFVEFKVNTNNKSEAENEVKNYCDKLLVNPIMEDFDYTLSEWTPPEEEIN